MAALAYIFPPISGLIAYFSANAERVRLHGLQSVVFGLLWPVSLYACSAISPGATQAAFFTGLGVWLLLFALTLFGLNPRIPGTGSILSRLTAAPPR
jgi:uncharacterized membrane protein